MLGRVRHGSALVGLGWARLDHRPLVTGGESLANSNPHPPLQGIFFVRGQETGYKKLSPLRVAASKTKEAPKRTKTWQQRILRKERQHVARRASRTPKGQI